MLARPPITGEWLLDTPVWSTGDHRGDDVLRSSRSDPVPGSSVNSPDASTRR
jgi:hypothetical protein